MLTSASPSSLSPGVGLVAALALLPAVAGAAEAQVPQVESEPTGATVTGVTVDATTRAPLAAVLVVIRATDGDSTTTTLTGTDGRFLLGSVPVGSYQIEFSRIGYAELARSGIIRPDSLLHALGTVALEGEALVLDGVVATTERPAVVHAEDRDIYDVEAMAASSGGSATDLLASLPDLEVEPDGTINLGGTPPQIYIDGRPAPFEGEALQAFLESLPAEGLESIEVMTNPSARYDAEGAGGVVNLVSRRDFSLGLRGSGSFNAGSNGDLGSSGRVTWQSGPLTVISNSSLRRTQRDTRRLDLRRNLRADPNTFLEQDAVSDRDSWSGNLNLQATYDLGERTSLTGEGRVVSNHSDTDRVTTYTQMEHDREVTDVYDRIAFSETLRRSAQVALGFEHVIERRRHELTGEIHYETGVDDDESLVRQRVRSQDPDRDFDHRLTNDFGMRDRSGLRFRLDYRRPGPLGAQLETGYRAQLSDNDDRRERRVALDGELEGATPVPRGGLAHEQTIHSLYFTGSRRIAQLNAQVGLRGEHVARRFHYPGQEEPVDHADLNFFPSANLNYSPRSGRRIRLSYSLRVRRPTANVLNPVDRSSDPMHRRIGNPDIDAQRTHSWNLDLSWSGTLGTVRVAPSFQKTVGEWAQIQTVDESDVATTTWQNVASSTIYNTTVTLTPRRIRGIGGSLNISSRRQERDRTALGESAPRVSTRMSTRANVDARFSSVTLQGSLSYNPPRDLPQGVSAATTNMTTTVRYRFRDGRANLNASLSDPFGLYRPSTFIENPRYLEHRDNLENSRRLTISLSYNFGQSGR